MEHVSVSIYFVTLRVTRHLSININQTQAQYKHDRKTQNRTQMLNGNMDLPCFLNFNNDDQWCSAVRYRFGAISNIFAKHKCEIRCFWATFFSSYPFLSGYIFEVLVIFICVSKTSIFMFHSLFRGFWFIYRNIDFTIIFLLYEFIFVWTRSSTLANKTCFKNDIEQTHHIILIINGNINPSF